MLLMEMSVSEEIINLIEDIKSLLITFNDSKVEYYDKVTNRYADIVIRKANL